MADAILDACKQAHDSLIARVRSWVNARFVEKKAGATLDITHADLGWLREHEIVTRARTTRVTIIIEQNKGGAATTDSVIFDNPACFDLSSVCDYADQEGQMEVTGTVMTLLCLRR